MKKIVLMSVCSVSLLCICIRHANAQSVVSSLGIQGSVGTLGEVFPDQSKDASGSLIDSEINNRLFLEWGFFYEVKLPQPGYWFHDIYFSYGRSKGKYSYMSYENNFYGESYTAMYRIGGYIMSDNSEATRGFGYAGLGLALDRYYNGDFSDATNSMLAGKPYLVRPVFAIGGGFQFEHVTINLLEIRLDIRFQRQPQNDFQDYMNWNAGHEESSHWTGAVCLYSGIAYNF